MNISQISNLYCFQDGDTIIPGMGVSIDSGYGLSQYWDANTNKVINTDFSAHHAILYPQAYSSKAGTFVVPASGRWYYNNIAEASAITDANNAVVSAFADRFEVTTVTVNGMTFPALKIKGNIATSADHTDKYIYYVASYSDSDFTCQKLIPIQVSVGSSYNILISAAGQDGSGDEVLSNDNDYVILTPVLQLAGSSILTGVTYKWQKLSGSATWTDITSTSGVIEISNNKLIAYNAGVEGVEMFRCVATYKNVDYYAFHEVSDIHDPYYIDMGRSQASDAVQLGTTVTYSPKVYDRSTGAVDTSHSWTFTFTVMKYADGSVIRTATGSLSVAYSEISNNNGIKIKIEASA